MNQKPPVVIVSHDAGGAEILSSWIAEQSVPYLLVLEGPAKEIFQKKLGKLSVLPMEEAIAKAGWVLTGTSWQSDLELTAIKAARKLGIKSISYIDHWVNYLERFERGGTILLPDEIWVGDKDALKISSKVFPELRTSLVPNPYFADIKSKIEEINDKASTVEAEKYILYVCSPIREQAKKQYGDALYWGFSEEDAVRYFMTNMHILKHHSNNVLLRPHPSEENGKYDWVIKEFTPHISLGGKRDLQYEIAGADIVVGYDSMAMVVGLIAGKRVIDAVPPGKFVSNLPMEEIERLEDLLKSKPL